MTHAAGHGVVEGEPSIEKQLFAERDDGAVGRSGRQRRQPKRNSDFERRLDGSQPQRVVTKTIAVSQTFTALISKIIFAFLELQRFDVIHQNIRIEKSRGIDFPNPALRINKKTLSKGGQ